MTRSKEDWLKQFKAPSPSTSDLSKMTKLETTGLKTVRFMRWQAMTSRKPNKNAAAILILNPDTFEPDVPYERVLTLRFWDHAGLDLVDHWIARLFGRNPERCVSIRNQLRRKKSAWPWRPPLQADARDIRDFLNSLPAEISEIDVACEYGRSRSRAVAEWIAAKNKIEATGSREKGRPNPRLVKLLDEEQEIHPVGG